ncbi:MAG TPA: hypothetical protein EYH57_03260 [Sulfurovum sp.]|nr:hypothetical protein [Sulfurovum sp.]
MKIDHTVFESMLNTKGIDLLKAVFPDTKNIHIFSLIINSAILLVKLHQILKIKAFSFKHFSDRFSVRNI